MMADHDEHRSQRDDPPGRGRKERVLHTRVSEALAEDIRRIAGDLRVPASNLVRNVLEEVFDVVESVSDDVGDLFEEMLDEAEAARERIGRARSRSRKRRRGRRSPTSERDRSAWRAARSEVDAMERSADATPPPLPRGWHFDDGGRAAGPVSRDELAALAGDGRLGPDTLVWCAGMAEWAAAGGVDELAGVLAPPPLPSDEETTEGG